MDQLDDVDAIRVSRHSQSQILNNHLVIGGFDQSFRFLHFARCIYLESMPGEIITHGKTDRFLIVDHEQIPWAGFGRLAGCALFPATEKLSEAARHGSEVQH